jgi:phosphoglycolate phosphatase-like HAD superfamily hydrolase
VVQLGLEFGQSPGRPVIRDQLATALREARAVLFDFDGPICSVFAGLPAPSIARELRHKLETWAGQNLATTGSQAADPIEILRLATTLGPAATALADDLLTEAETTAVAAASPTPGGEGSLRACVAAGRRAAIVSNNSATAVAEYLRLHDLADLALAIIGREYSNPHRMKPDPAPIYAALRSLDVAPDAAVLVGDSITDIQAAHAAGIRCIAYANKPGKWEQFSAAQVIIDDMALLAECLTHTPIVTD